MHRLKRKTYILGRWIKYIFVARNRNGNPFWINISRNYVFDVNHLKIWVSYMLLAMFATMEKMFIEVARKTICEILTAAASALVGHLYKENHFLQHPKLNFIRSQTKIIAIVFINIFQWIGKIIYSTYVVISLIQR